MVAPAAGQRAEVGRVGVGQAALARQAHERARGLLEERLAGVVREVGVGDRRLRRTAAARGSGTRPARGSARACAASGVFRRVSGGTAARSWRARPPSSRSEISRARLADERQLGVERGVGRARARQRVAREARASTAAPSSARPAPAGPRAARRAARAWRRAGCPPGGRTPAIVSFRSVTRSFSCCSSRTARRTRAPWPSQHAAQVVGLLAERGVADLRGVRGRRPPSA